MAVRELRGDEVADQVIFWLGRAFVYEGGHVGEQFGAGGGGFGGGGAAVAADGGLLGEEGEVLEGDAEDSVDDLTAGEAGELV